MTLGLTWAMTIQDFSALLAAIAVIVIGLSFCVRTAWKQGKAAGKTQQDMEQLKKCVATAILNIELLQKKKDGNVDLEKKIKSMLGDTALQGVDFTDLHEGDSK